jgi:signal transduction histidine kinase
MAQLLQKELKGPKQNEKIRIIRESGEALGTILDDILQVSRMDAGKLELEDGVVEPASVAQRIKELHDLRADEKGLELDVFVSSSVHAAYRGDAGRIVQILHNLVSNSIKFTEEGDVSVVIRPRREGGIVLEVKDTGMGMTPEQCDRILEDFAQADSSTTRKFGGAGLGVGIVKRLSNLMGGTFELQSEIGKGTCVTVQLPLEEINPV